MAIRVATAVIETQTRPLGSQQPFEWVNRLEIITASTFGAALRLAFKARTTTVLAAAPAS